MTRDPTVTPVSLTLLESADNVVLLPSAEHSVRRPGQPDCPSITKDIAVTYRSGDITEGLTWW